MEFDLAATYEDDETFSVLWALLRAESVLSVDREPALLSAAIQASSILSERVGKSLRTGVIDALQTLLNGLALEDDDLLAGFEESLTVVYRILFLMFAEARGLVPSWHPIYRDGYTVNSLIESIQSGRTCGLWEGLQAISRLAHEGCSAGTLNVPAFNGRLFSPARSPMAESRAVEDGTASNALRALCLTVPQEHKRSRPIEFQHRIDFRDLGVEQLGTIYESVLDYVPVKTNSADPQKRFTLRRNNQQRKSTGSFYTPQSITEYIVRRALHPLVREASPAQILGLRVVDPAMGTAAFLVSACRYLAHCYESALVRSDQCRETDVSDDDRASFRRAIAQRCLYGIDLNPTAVQLGRLSLWLATLAAGKPLTFLDHHLVCGDSLIGASSSDVLRQPPGVARSQRWSKAAAPLFDGNELESSVRHAVAERKWMADTDDETPALVQEKENRLLHLRQGTWKSVADLWCACWLWQEPEARPDQRLFATLVDEVARGRASLPKAVSLPILDKARHIAGSRRFFHWALEFPEVFHDESGLLLENPGFDAVIGNPPWDVLKAGDSGARQFFRVSGVYRYQSRDTSTCTNFFSNAL